MSGKRIGAVLLVTAAAWSLQSAAQTGEAEARAALQREQASLSQQIEDRRRQLQTLRSRPGPEQAELAAARAALDAARAEDKAAGTEKSQARLQNAEFKFALAERKANRADTEQETLNEEIAQLQRRLAAGQQQLKNLDRPAGPPAAADTRQQHVASERLRRQAQELERTRREAENQQKEIERLKALLAAKEVAAKKTAASAPAPKSIAKPAPKKSAPQAPGGLYKITDRQAMLRELQSLEKRLDGLSTRSRGGINEALYLKPKAAAKVTNKNRITLRALGLEQYRGEADIEPGEYELILGLNHWPLRIDDGESGVFVFLYDNRDSDKPQLALYNRRLEDNTSR